MADPSWLERNKDLLEPIATLISVPVSFVLITVAGSIIGYFLQKNLFNHQKTRDSIERSYNERRDVFDKLSIILDRRIYQYRQIVYGWWRNDPDWVEREFSALRNILFEWNGQINSIYGKVQIFFGPSLRNELEIGVGTQMRKVQRLLEEKKRGQAGAKSSNDIWKEIDILNGKTDALYRHMLNVIDNDALLINGNRKKRKRF
tara:strand:+ start:129 stop:737 length:609 start_codon:yes stop_codon:yes gene_type:complete